MDPFIKGETQDEAAVHLCADIERSKRLLETKAVFGYPQIQQSERTFSLSDVCVVRIVDTMEIPERSSPRKRDAALIVDAPIDSPTISSLGTLTEANINLSFTADCIPPQKRPKRLSISCDERGGSHDSLSSFVPGEKTIIDVRVVSVSEDIDFVRVLNCLCEKTGETYQVKLEGIWSSTPVQAGSSIRLIGPKVLSETELFLDWKDGVVILESSVLVPCTLIAQGTYCRRKAVLSYYFKGQSGSNKEMLVGNVVHELFQIAVTRPEFNVTESTLRGLWRKELCSKYVEQLLALDLSAEEVEDELCGYFETIAHWSKTHMTPPKGRNEQLQEGSKILKVVDIEESLWNSCYGFKAKVDCTLKVETRNGEQKLLPVELKTGKSNPNTEHTTQVMLYCLAFASKQGAIGNGLLLYLLDEISRTVVPKTTDLKGILQMRNEIVAGISAVSFDMLPEPLSDTRGCGWCSQALSCSLLQHNSNSHATENFFKNQLAHLEQSHINYFKKFARWILMEWGYVAGTNCDKENLNRRKKSALPCMKVILQSVRQLGNKTVVTFQREGIVIDEQQELFLKSDMLLVRSLNNEILTVASVLCAEGICLDVVVNGICSSLVAGRTYFIEKHESSSTFTINLGNLAVLMKDDKQMSKIRSLIIDMRPPTFSKMKREDILGMSDILRQLNGDQARAVVKSLMANDFTIIEGFPGSGKTSTLVILIRCLIFLGRTILVTSHTHSAIDNLLSKLVQFIDDNKILRLGQRTSVKESLQHLTLESKLSKVPEAEKVSRMQIMLKETPIVASTCLGVSTNLLFSYRRFSMTLVDEASLVLEPTIISAIAVSDSFVLVGDHRQLTPLVRSQQAKQEGLAKSLLERLIVHHSAVITLHLQYRMNRPIAELSSAVFYENKLRCANGTVAEAHLSDLSSETVNHCNFAEAYNLCVSNSLDKAIVFVDTNSRNNLSFRATFGKSGAEVTNSGEAQFVVGLCELFLKIGLPESDLGVISVYRFHAERLRRMLEEGIEVNTVDQYQGRDKPVIVLSFVWTGEGESRKSELLADFRRVNVAVTRAKYKLILVGCRKSLSSCSPVKAVVDAIPESCITMIQE